MLEREIEHKLIKPVRKLGGLCIKFEVPGYTGLPDRLILLPGAMVVFVETKAPGEKERKRQLYIQALLRRLGFPVFSTVDSAEKVEQVLSFCEEVCRGANL